MKLSHIATVIRKLFRKRSEIPCPSGPAWDLLPYEFRVDWYCDVSGEIMMTRETLHLSGNAVRQSLTYRKNR